MGLIKSGIKYGAIFMVAKKGLEAYENRKQPNQQQYQQPPQAARTAEPNAYYMQPAQQGPDHLRNASGSFHQPWCSGHCGGQCIPAEQWRSFGVDVPAAPAYQDVPAKS